MISRVTARVLRADIADLGGAVLGKRGSPDSASFTKARYNLSLLGGSKLIFDGTNLATQESAVVQAPETMGECCHHPPFPIQLTR